MGAGTRPKPSGDSGTEPTPELKYRRILLKLSGEALAGDKPFGIDRETLSRIAAEIIDVHKLDVQIGLVLGGGNIFRGLSASAKGMDRTSADHMGMLATVMNSLALQDAIESLGVPTRVQTAITMTALAEPYIRRRAMRHLEKRRIVIFAGGTGNPYFSTDTAAALRANEIHAEIILKATKVEGVFDKDPELHADASMYRSLSYLDVLNRNLRVMDATAISLCKDNAMPIRVFNLTTSGNIRRAVLGDDIGTLVRELAAGGDS